MMSFTEMRKSGRGIGLGMIIPSKILTFNRALFFIFKHLLKKIVWRSEIGCKERKKNSKCMTLKFFFHQHMRLLTRSELEVIQRECEHPTVYDKC